MKMDDLPYLSSYLLIYSFALNLIFWFMPAPYGKFSAKKAPLAVIPSDWFYPLITVWFVTFYIGWLEDGEIKQEWPTSDNPRGQFLLVWLSIYFFCRTILSPFACMAANEDDSNRGEKTVSLLLIIPYFFFWGPAGIFWRRAVTKIDAPLESYDYILMVLAAIFLALNLYSDINTNHKRHNGKEDIGPWCGKYLDEEQLYEDFSSMKGLWHTFSLPPNYMFEVAHWFIVIFLSRSWEGLWWFCSIFMFLLTRGVWQKKWYQTKETANIVNEVKKPQVVVVDSANVKIINKLTF